MICSGCGEENPAKFRLCGFCGTPLGGPAALPVRELRKTVTILFSDLRGSTALGERLDAEALHEVKDRYFAAMSAAIVRHGGRVEKFIGDAVMAVFGLPRAREDDALRAVRAAVDMQGALKALNADLQRRYGVELANRTGVNTGEVVANDDPNANQQLATGDAVNVAARLEQAAPENEVYLGESTWRLVRDAVTAEAVEPLTLKGKSQTVPAWRLLGASGIEGVARRLDTPLVGRDAEIAALDAARDEALATRSPRLVTVLGEAGMGKSRLVHEAIQRAGPDAKVLRGRCLPYGDGITFWALLMMLREAAGIEPTDGPAAACDKLRGALGDAAVADRLAAAAGLADGAYALAEIHWAARRFFETWAAPALLVVVVDDIHWAEPALLALLEDTLAGVNAPLLLLCTSRPELLDEQPGWAKTDRARRLPLKPLDDAASGEVVAHLLGDTGLGPDVVARIVGAAEGNPLYVEQLLEMLLDAGLLQSRDGQWRLASDHAGVAVPPTIHALLEARLDALDRPERATIDAASVVGQEFPPTAVQALAPEPIRPTIGTLLDTLVRRRFVNRGEQVDRSVRYRFHHHLVRETAYGALLKRARATLHVQFVRWADAENAGSDRVIEFEAILGYHLEQAHRYLSELGPVDAEGRAIAADASARLARAGRRAFAIGDSAAAVNLLRRAVALRDDDDPRRPALRAELGEVLMDIGAFDDARTVLDLTIDEARARGDALVESAAGLLRMRVRLFSGEPGEWAEPALQAAQEAIPRFEAVPAHAELARAWRLVGFIHGTAGRYEAATDAVRRSIEHARSAGDARLVARGAMGLAVSALLGPTPVVEAIASCERALARQLGDRQAESKILCTLGQLRAMNGEFDAARALVRRGRALLTELGQIVATASTAIDVMAVELLAGDLAAAEVEARADLEFLTAAGETFVLSAVTGMLARVVRDQGRDAQALELSVAAERASADDDVESQAIWRMVRAPIVARAGDVAQGESLARAAIEWVGRTDAATLQADALIELASVLRIAGRAEEARATAADAVAIYAAKGDRVSSARWAAWMAPGA